jgi:hypothetical protein
MTTYTELAMRNLPNAKLEYLNNGRLLRLSYNEGGAWTYVAESLKELDRLLAGDKWHEPYWVNAR